MTRWHCKVCKTWGVGSASEWTTHWKSEHEHNGRYNAYVSFGFTGDYSSGSERWYDRRIAPAIAKDSA